MTSTTVRFALLTVLCLSMVACTGEVEDEGTFDVGDSEAAIDGACAPLTLNASGVWYPDGFYMSIDGRATNCTSRKTRISMALVTTDASGQVVSLGGYSKITGSWRLDPSTGVTYFTTRYADGVAPGDVLTLTATSNQGSVITATVIVP